MYLGNTIGGVFQAVFIVWALIYAACLFIKLLFCGNSGNVFGECLQELQKKSFPRSFYSVSDFYRYEHVFEELKEVRRAEGKAEGRCKAIKEYKKLPDNEENAKLWETLNLNHHSNHPNKSKFTLVHE